jgi:putative phosphoribosyl transferase
MRYAEQSIYGEPQLADRDHAGRLLARALARYRGQPELIVLALPRGGVPVAAPIAQSLDAPLDVCVVRKIGVPDHEELALGAIASGGARVFNRDLVEQLDLPTATIEQLIADEERELRRRESAYRGDRPFPELHGRTVIVVDDGAATGASMLVAVRALRQLKPRMIIVAVPIASREAIRLLAAEVDDCVCLAQPEPFYGVGAWYEDFSQLSDTDVRAVLTRVSKAASGVDGPQAADASRSVRGYPTKRPENAGQH